MPDFDDLLTANQNFADSFDLGELAGQAASGLAMVTCMDSRIDPLKIVGLQTGDAKILRNPGGRVTDQMLTALVLAVTLLNVDRIMIVEHTRCAMATSSEAELRERVGDSAGKDASWMTLGAIADQDDAIRHDVDSVRGHPLIGDDVLVGGFIYEVETGLLKPVD